MKEESINESPIWPDVVGLHFLYKRRFCSKGSNTRYIRKLTRCAVSTLVLSGLSCHFRSDGHIKKAAQLTTLIPCSRSGGKNYDVMATMLEDCGPLPASAHVDVF